jgi:hypothetical protein
MDLVLPTLSKCLINLVNFKEKDPIPIIVIKI